MKKETKIDVKNIEEEFQFHGLQAGKSPPEYWRNLGSSKTRTKEQEIKGRDLTLHKITETTENTAIAFTDGLCLNNPGPCGAGAIVFVEEETTELKQPVCKRGSILSGELIAIKIVLEYIDQPEIRRKIEQLTIFSDWKIENHKRITLEILDKMKRIQKNGIEIKIHWTPGHANVNGNEIADRLAKEAAKEAEHNQSDTHNTITKQDVKKAARDHIMEPEAPRSL
jgi:ribonuclease HI